MVKMETLQTRQGYSLAIFNIGGYMTRTIKILFIFLITISCSAFAGVDKNDLNNIYKLIDAGDYQKALEKHIWFHEESKKSPSMGGVRLSYALTSWVALGEKYPKALVELKKIRDSNDSLLRSGKGNFSNFHDLSAINRQLKQSNLTVELFKYLDKNHFEQAKRYYHAVEATLMEIKDYKLCGKYIDNPVFKYESLRYNRESSLNSAKNYPQLNTPEHYNYIDKAYLTGVLNLLEVLTALKREEDKNQVLERASSYFGYSEIRKQY